MRAHVSPYSHDIGSIKHHSVWMCKLGAQSWDLHFPFATTIIGVCSFQRLGTALAYDVPDTGESRTVGPKGRV